MNEKKLEKIAIVELESDVPNLGQILAMPRFGITVIGSKLAEAGYDVDVLTDAYTEITLDTILENKPDIVMFNSMKTSLDKIKKMAKDIKNNNPDIPIIMGGEEATVFPEEFLNFSDYVITHEGDETVIKLTEAIRTDSDLSGIKGIVYNDKQTGKLTKTEMPDRVKEINYKLKPSIFKGLADISKSWLARKLGLTKSKKGYRALSFPLQTSRGCKYTCTFCTQRQLFGKPGYVTRNIDNVIADIDAVIENTGISHFTVVDNLFGGNKKEGIDFYKELITHYNGKEIKPNFTVLMRADQFNGGGFTDKEMHLMRKAGIKKVSIGMESVNEKTLEEINKKADINKYINAIKRLKEHSIGVTGTFGVGGGEDTKHDITAISDFAKAYGIDAIHLYSFTICPGTPEYEKSKHLVIHGVPDKYINGHAVTILPKNMLPSELQEGVIDTMCGFYSWKTAHGVFYKRQLKKIKVSLKDHLDRLKTIESDMIDRGIYVMNDKNGNWELNEEKIKENPVNYKI